jgi:hypothetical protein
MCFDTDFAASNNADDGSLSANKDANGKYNVGNLDCDELKFCHWPTSRLAAS